MKTSMVYMYIYVQILREKIDRPDYHGNSNKLLFYEFYFLEEINEFKNFFINLTIKSLFLLRFIYHQLD